MLDYKVKGLDRHFPEWMLFCFWSSLSLDITCVLTD